ncbi:MAG: hypothetical protein JSR26_03875 [Proteobacteria bacterium]|nr:hypothetical protein [Pseudomonadota bacterium]
MSAILGYVDNTGSEGLAHWQLLKLIKTTAEANGWTTLRYTTPVDGSPRELILRGVGLSGDQQILIGFRSYHNVAADYYNLSCAGFVGYVPGNTFATQPGYFESGVPAHNRRVDYWLVCNAQRIAFGLKVGTPVYMHGYAGFFLPYATPGQYPYPLAVGGMLAGIAATRYSDPAISMPYRGACTNLGMRFVDGTWKNTDCHPWSGWVVAGNAVGNPLTGDWTLRDTGGTYRLLPILLSDIANIYGEFDGVRAVSGFDNVTENTTTIAGVTHVVLEDGARTGFADYIALELT